MANGKKDQVILDMRPEVVMHVQAAEMLLSKGLLSNGSRYRTASPQASLPPQPRTPSGGWQPAARSFSSGSPGASGSLRALLKQACSLCPCVRKGVMSYMCWSSHHRWLASAFCSSLGAFDVLLTCRL